MLLNHLRTPHGDSLIKQNVFTSFQEEQEEEEASPAEREGERFGCQKRTSPEEQGKCGGGERLDKTEAEGGRLSSSQHLYVELLIRDVLQHNS